MYSMTRRQISSTRSASFAALAMVVTLGVLAPASVFADTPVAEPAPETGEVDGAIVAVGAPPVPTTTVVVAVGQPPVPPTQDVVAVGQPPVPPTQDVVAVGQPPVPPAPAAIRRPAQPVIVVSADALRSTADAALDVLDSWF